MVSMCSLMLEPSYLFSNNPLNDGSSICFGGTSELMWYLVKVLYDTDILG